MKQKALSSGEADMTVRVFRKDGTVEEHKGDEVTIEVDPAMFDLIAEYKQITERARQIELLISPFLQNRQKE